MNTVYDRIRNRTSWKTRLKVWVLMRVLLIKSKVNKMKINWYRLLFLILVGLAVLVGLESIAINPIIKYLTVIALLYALQGDDPIITNKDQDE